MAVCPKCGKEVSFLEEFEQVTQKYRFTRGIDGLGNYEYEEDVATMGGSMEFCCPECGEAIFWDSELALKFLRGIE